MKAHVYMFFCLILFYGFYASAIQEAEEYNIDIHAAVSRGDIEEVRAFIDGARVIDELSVNSDTPLHVVCKWTGSLSMENRQQICQEIISMLIRAGTDLKARNRGGQTPLHHIVQLVVKNVVPFSSLEEMVQMGADATSADDSGNTLLHSVFLNTDGTRIRPGVTGEVIDYLVSLGVDINAENRVGRVPLDLASRYSTASVVSHLIENGADVAMAERSLHNAVQAGSFEITHRLLEAGANVHETDDQGRTPLHLATEDDNSLPIVFLLIQHRSHIHAEAHDGWTPYLQIVERAQSDSHNGFKRYQYEMFIDFIDRDILLRGNHSEGQGQLMPYYGDSVPYGFRSDEPGEGP